MGEADPTERIVRFLREIGLKVEFGVVDEAAVLPGVEIRRGVLVVEQELLAHPGDLLHEAGHLATMSGWQRAHATGNAGTDGGYEMAAIAWSYAAVLHLGLDPAVVFHEEGYRGGSTSLIENFTAGRYVGVPMLQWLGMTVAAGTADGDIDPYPSMSRWLRE